MAVYDYDISDYLVTITPGGIQGILQEGSLSLPFGMSAGTSQIAGKLNFKEAIKNVAAGVGNAILPGAGDTFKSATKSVYEMIKTYDGSNDMSISLSVLVVPGKFGMPSDYSSIMSAISKLTLPQVDNNIMLSQIAPPSKVKDLSNDWKSLDGLLCGISIGSWFHTNPIFWCTGASMSYSTMIDTQGRPSHLTISFSFEPYRPVINDDVAGWIS